MTPRRNKTLYEFVVNYLSKHSRATSREMYYQFNECARHGTTIYEITQVISRHSDEICVVGSVLIPRETGGSTRHLLYALRCT